jgi:hypothetical protein
MIFKIIRGELLLYQMNSKILFLLQAVQDRMLSHRLYSFLITRILLVKLLPINIIWYKPF